MFNRSQISLFSEIYSLRILLLWNDQISPLSVFIKINWKFLYEKVERAFEHFTYYSKVKQI